METVVTMVMSGTCIQRYGYTPLGVIFEQT